MSRTQNPQTGRNYQIDLIKFILTIFVFLNHTLDFKQDMPLGKIFFTGSLGWISVHYFFIISGFLMCLSFDRKYGSAAPEHPGADTSRFIFRKFGSIAPQYYAAFVIALGSYLVTVHERISAGYLCDLSYKLIPELLLINRTGVDPIYMNLPTWYIQSMLICMIPMYYLLSRKRDMFLNVIAPLGAIISYSYIYRNGMFIDAKAADHIITSGMLRAFCGLFCGCAAYKLCEMMKKMGTDRRQRRLMTAAEVLIYLWMFIGCFTPHCDKKSHFLAMLLIPPATAVTFSGASNVGRLFSSPKLRVLNSLSLAIYFNNWPARRLVLKYFPDMSWGRSTAYMAALTVLFCAVYFIIIRACRMIWEKQLKKLFVPAAGDREE